MPASYDQVVQIQHGAYEAELKLYDIPYNEMVGMLSIRDPEREIIIKLEADDIINIKLAVNEYCEDKQI